MIPWLLPSTPHLQGNILFCGIEYCKNIFFVIAFLFRRTYFQAEVIQGRGNGCLIYMGKRRGYVNDHFFNTSVWTHYSMGAAPIHTYKNIITRRPNPQHPKFLTWLDSPFILPRNKELDTDIITKSHFDSHFLISVGHYYLYKWKFWTGIKKYKSNYYFFVVSGVSVFC